MSRFHEDFLLQLRADLAQALGLPAAAVYSGDRPQQKARAGLEVWIKPGDAQPGGPNVTVHPYEVHVRLRARRAGNQTGGLLDQAMKTHLATLRQRYDGARPFVQAVPALVACSVASERAGEPDEQDVFDGHLVLNALEVG